MMEESVISENEISHLETPLGDKDKHLKIQLCIEFRKTEAKQKGKNPLKTSNRSIPKQLSVTISNLKNVPKLDAKSGNPFVKVRLIPDNVIYTTEYVPPKLGEVQYFETFEFPIDDLVGKQLQVQVCDKKVTRSAKSFGSASISVEGIPLGKPLVQWYDLNQD